MKPMNKDEQKALEAIARAYYAAPNYLFSNQDKYWLERSLIEAIDALDIVEYSRTKRTFLSLIQNEIPFHRKRTVMSLVEENHLTPREGHVLRYLANGHNAAYIAQAMNIAKTTARSHIYSIYKKLNVHSKKELDELLQNYDLN